MARELGPRSGVASSWIAGIVLGVIAGVGLLSFGMFGLGFLAIAVLLIAWKGPRLIGGAGLVTGLGLIWTVLLARVQVTCGPWRVFPEEGCFSEDLTAWIAGGLVIFVGGLVASAVAVRRSIRRG